MLGVHREGRLLHGYAFNRDTSSKNIQIDSCIGSSDNIIKIVVLVILVAVVVIVEFEIELQFVLVEAIVVVADLDANISY